MTEERGMPLVDRIEKRRFVGHEFLLWLWMESEAFEGTLETKEHGAFGLWIERQIVLAAGKPEVTRIKGSYPASTREAKESLLRGKAPELAGVHVSIGGRDASFVLKADRMALSGLRLPTVLGDEEDAAPEGAPRPPRGRRKSRSREEEALAESDERHEAFYERMHLTRELEELIEALYRDFLALRLSSAWDSVVLPALRAWVDPSRSLDVEAYRKARTTSTRRAASASR